MTLNTTSSTTIDTIDVDPGRTLKLDGSGENIKSVHGQVNGRSSSLPV